ncbi:MAG: basic amino acid ABC transporter substrate-binding protein [Spirochaetes bacterium]|nr:basic amino acid ABC transporter substrate-binding protein [Spirochaetota bacterium]
MKKLSFIAALLLIAAITACSGKSSGSKNKLIIGTDATWPPMEYLNANKEIIGFDIDLMKAVAEAGGFEVEFVNAAWDGIFAALDNGKFDAVISSITITDERKNSMDFSIPYINAGQVLVIKKDLTGVETLADLKGKSVGAQIGTTGAMEITNSGATLKNYDELGLAMEDLANGRIDGVVCDTPIAANFALQNEKYKPVLKIAGKPFTQEFYGIAVKKGNSEIVEKINTGLKAVIDSGKTDELEKQWLR